MLANLDRIFVSDSLCTYRPSGKHTLVETVDLISRAIAHCRDSGLSRLLIDVSGIEDLPIPTLLDRFLMVEDWAQAAGGTVVVALVAPAKYIHPRKFGVKVAAHFGLVCDVCTSEDEAAKWLREIDVPPAASRG